MEIQKKISTVDTHTEGEPTRIVIEGMPYFKKVSMIEIKEEIRKNFDYIRKFLMNEPRGHAGMFGAILLPPVNEECDYGVIFMDTGGYCNMCGHGSIGVAKYAIESGVVEKKYPLTKIKVDTPAGIVQLEVNFENKKIKNISLINVKSFNYLYDLVIKAGGIDIPLDIAFGGNFFAIIDADKIGLDIHIDNIEKIIKLGMEILKYLKANLKIIHPYISGINSVDLVQFNSKKGLNKSHNKNTVIFGNNQYDRSPCGTGTCAKLANLYFKNEIKVDEKFINESIIGTKFVGKVLKEDDTNNLEGIIPMISGNAYITAYSDFVLENTDKFW